MYIYDFCVCGRVLSDLYVYIVRAGREGWDDYLNLWRKEKGGIRAALTCLCEGYVSFVFQPL